jgi:hypothetical protein
MEHKPSIELPDVKVYLVTNVNKAGKEYQMLQVYVKGLLLQDTYVTDHMKDFITLLLKK